MGRITNAKRVNKYKVGNPKKVKRNKLNEYAAIAEKRINDPLFDSDYKVKERDRKRRQRAQKKKNDAVVGSLVPLLSVMDGSAVPLLDVMDGSAVPLLDMMDESAVPPLDVTDGSAVPLLDVMDGYSLPLLDLGSTSSDISDIQFSFISSKENTSDVENLIILPPLFTSTPAPVKEKLKVRIPFKDKSNILSKTQSRQARQGLMVRKKNNYDKNDELAKMKTILNKSEEENIEKDFEITEKNIKIRELQSENNALKEKLKSADDWLTKTYKYMTPTGRNELKMGAYLAKEEFETGTLRRIRENTGLNFSKSPTLVSEECSGLEKSVQEFAFENSSEVPDMKAAKKGIRYFYCYKTVLWIQFLSSSGLEISYSQFCRYWPEKIVKPKIEDFGSCKCIPCENTELLLNSMKRQDCVSKEHQLDIMIKDIRSGDATLEKRFVEDLDNLDTGDKKTKTLTYLHWENVHQENGKRDVVHRVQKTASCADAVNLMKTLYEDLKKHLERNFVMKTTLKQRKEYVMNSDDQAYIHMDWAENLEIKIPGEVQSAFFSHTSVSLHTGYLYSKADSGGFVSLSDNGCHKAEAIHAAIKPVIAKLVQSGIKHIVCVSDSPTSQYRNNKNMWLTKELAVTHNITIEWLFTEAGHGKSVCDGIGGTVKNLLRDITAFNTSLAISSARDVMNLITPHTSIDLFWFDKAEIEEVQKSLPGLGSLTGATKIHQVQFDSLGNMFAKKLPTDPISQKIKLKVLRNKNTD